VQKRLPIALMVEYHKSVDQQTLLHLAITLERYRFGAQVLNEATGSALPFLLSGGVFIARPICGTPP
jgi:hypothetical protein